MMTLGSGGIKFFPSRSRPSPTNNMRQDPDPNKISSRDGIPLFNSDNPSRSRARPGFSHVGIGIGSGIRDKNRDRDSPAGPQMTYRRTGHKKFLQCPMYNFETVVICKLRLMDFEIPGHPSLTTNTVRTFANVHFFFYYQPNSGE